MTGSITLITLHGINTDGAWQEDLAPLFSAHYNYAPIKYDKHKSSRGFWNVVTGWDFLETVKLVSTLVTEEAKKGEMPDIYVISHSYGTVISAYLMEAFPYIWFERIIFLGSAVNCRFNWYSPMMQSKNFLLTNEHGSRDAAVLGARYLPRGIVGSAGRYGFKGSGVHTLKPLGACGKCAALPENEKVKVHNTKIVRV